MFLVCEPCSESSLAEYLRGRYLNGHVGVVVYPADGMCTIVVSTLGEEHFAWASQTAVEAGVQIKAIDAATTWLALLVPTHRAAGVARMLAGGA